MFIDSNLEKIKQESVWSDEQSRWRVPDLVVQKTKLPPAGEFQKLVLELKHVFKDFFWSFFSDPTIIFSWFGKQIWVEMFYLNSTLNFGIPPVLLFQLEVYYKVDRLLTGLTAQQKGTNARWYSNKTYLSNLLESVILEMIIFWNNRRSI